jgi:NAD(P)-dependent dehydrogenase (short-subunit alcohol dehydrogenase family)
MEPKNYLIVGGSSGIGQEITRLLGETGHRVTVISRNRDWPGNMEGVTHRVGDATAENFDLDGVPPSLDGLAYCPGTIRLKPFRRLGRDDFLQDLEVNYLGAITVIQAALTRLRKSKQGASAVLFSTVAVGTGMPLHASIAGAKGAIEGLTRSLAAEFAPHIRFNAIAPSLTDTPLAAGLLEKEGSREAAARRHPLQRIGSPRDVAALAVHLLAGDSHWMTGQVLSVDGGMSGLRTFK